MDTKQQLLDLHKDIFLQTSTGYEARLSQAFVDMAKGTVTSDEHVDVKLPNGTITADKIKITGGGEVVRFEGNVVMNLDKSMPTPRRPSLPPHPPRPSPRPSGKTRSSPANPPTRNDLDDDVSPRSTSVGRIARGAGMRCVRARD